MKIPELYVITVTDFAGNVVGFPKGRSGSTQPKLRVFESLESAKRSNRSIHGKIMRVTALEEAES
jgi:hypothetical protein